MILRSLLALLIVHELRVTRADDSVGCGPPRVVEHTVPIQGTYPPNHSLRYKCASGFKRLAGTSDLITCKLNGTRYEWFTSLPLTCKADSRKTTTTTTTPSTPREHKTSTGTPPPSVEKSTTHDQWFDQSPFKQQAVVSGSVVAVVIFLLLMGLLFFLYTKKRPLLPHCINRRHRSSTMEMEDASEGVGMETQPNTESHPNSSTPLFEQDETQPSR